VTGSAIFDGYLSPATSQSKVELFFEEIKILASFARPNGRGIKVDTFTFTKYGVRKRNSPQYLRIMP